MDYRIPWTVFWIHALIVMSFVLMMVISACVYAPWKYRPSGLTVEVEREPEAALPEVTQAGAVQMAEGVAEPVADAEPVPVQPAVEDVENPAEPPVDDQQPEAVPDQPAD
ncbi:unnamed protein product, partial [Mesorhabditis spiculigera]